MKILLTGGTGRLGRIVVRQLLERGHSLRLVVRDVAKARALFGKQSAKMEFVNADLEGGSRNNVELISTACKGVRCAIHLAAQVDANASEAELLRANFNATVHLLESCKRAEVPRFIFCSTSSVFPKHALGEIAEESAFGPTNAYGRSKLAAEGAVRQSGVPFVILRPSLIYGPGFETGFGSVVKLLRKKRMVIVGKGDNLIAMVHGEDAARAFVLAAEAGKEVEGKSFNVSGESVAQKTSYGLVAKALGVPAPRIHVPKKLLLAAAHGVEAVSKIFGKKAFLRREYVETLAENRVFSKSLAEKALKWKPRHEFKHAVKSVATWF